MSIYAIADLHLPGGNDKPMNVFGAHWDNHFAQIAKNWQEKINADDVVLLPGDFSWAMTLEEVKADLFAVSDLPGQKILLRGNHDYWWNSIAKVRSILPEGMHALQNDALMLGNQVFCGTRGWNMPHVYQGFSAHDEKIFQRELLRLEMSLQKAVDLSGGKEVIVMMHFPPMLADGEATPFTDVISKYPVSHVLYGHLHGNGIDNGFCGQWGNQIFQLVSCDAIAFDPMMILL